jgi:hypothetical protein
MGQWWARRRAYLEAECRVERGSFLPPNSRTALHRDVCGDVISEPIEDIARRFLPGLEPPRRRVP